MVAFRSRDGGNRGPLPAALDPPRARDAEPFHDQAVPSADDCRRDRARDSPGAERPRLLFQRDPVRPGPRGELRESGSDLPPLPDRTRDRLRTIYTRKNILVASGGVAL